MKEMKKVKEMKKMKEVKEMKEVEEVEVRSSLKTMSNISKDEDFEFQFGTQLVSSLHASSEEELVYSSHASSDFDEKLSDMDVMLSQHVAPASASAPPSASAPAPTPSTALSKEYKSAGVSSRREFKPSAAVQSQIRRVEEGEFQARAKEKVKQQRLQKKASAPSTARSRKKNKKDVSQLIEAFEPLMSPPRRGRGRPKKQ